MGKPSISMGHLYHGYVTNNQRVYGLTQRPTGGVLPSVPPKDLTSPEADGFLTRAMFASMALSENGRNTIPIGIPKTN